MTERAAELTELHPWETHSLDIAKCDRTEIVVPLLAEFEKAGHRPESWPDAVRVLAFREAERWVESHDARSLRAITYAAPAVDGRQVCVLILHHTPKKV